ncbi:MAG: hypothetical protein M1840_007580 [Geoglossum simile]|nr:MAG: hypothetical protein M1840_007580 [Geoglossum simile]
MSNPSGYTVGWICAITTEYVAAQAFLDEKHEGPEYVSPNDNNNYTLGKIGKHNVVIAVLPDGEYGISSAASVARDMLHSFPNIRIGLMVGIGGGAPSQKHDIRIGDVVVSAPRNGESGVFQYDFGKTIQNQSFQHTRFLNQSPTILLTAVNGLKAQYEGEGHRLEAAINTVLDKKPRLRKYKRPDPSSDRLYQSGVTHPPKDQADCATTCGDDPQKLILRPERTEYEDNPAIHNGLIASANQLMKDASVRDKLVAEKDVLCFEMEAAGLMNHFPCLVIRGICDYSDSHKNKEWQGYAAMVAAAYAKDLLRYILPNRLEAEKRIGDILSGIQEGVSKLIYIQHDQEDKTILEWLTPIDYTPRQNDYIKRRQPGTGQWLLDSSEFQKWFKQKKPTLFCPGMPGAGKTIITSIVVEYLQTEFVNDTGVGVVYIYCSYQPQQEQKPEDLLLSILKQLAQKRPAMPPDIKCLHEHHKTDRIRPAFDEIVKVLHSTIKLFSRVFVIIDALDEYYALNNEGLKRLLSGVFSLQHQSQLSLLATSRSVAEITSQFEGCISKEIQAQDDDVLRYVNEQIPQLLRSHISRHPDVQIAIRGAIVKAASGMFLLAQLHMDSLMSQPTVGDIKQALMNLPQGLNETYGRAMERIQYQAEGYRKLAEQVLCWVTNAKRALSTIEIQHALAVRADTVQLDEDFLPEIEILGSVCAGLVVVDKNSGIVRLVHYTTQKYLEQISSFPNADRDIAATCVTYLLFDTFATGFCPTDEEFEARLQLNPLYDYAARNWGYHAQAVSIKDQLILRLLENKAKMSACSQALMASRGYRGDRGYSQRVPRQMTAVHLVAYFGLAKAMTGVLGNGHNPDLWDSYGRTPLLWAAEKGHEAVVKLLLATEKVDVDSKDGTWGRTPLSWAAEKGHEAVVKLLLATEKVDVNFKGSSWGRTPLSRAAEKGHEAVVKLLLATEKVDVDSQDWLARTPLSWAAEKGHEPVVKLLLATEKVDVNFKDSWGRTPLSWAAENGHEAVVKLLLATEKVDVNFKDERGRTPLSWAAENGHEAVVKLLLATEKVDVNFKGSSWGRTPLSWAAEKGHEAVVKLLLATEKVDVDSQDWLARTPLSWAAEKGHEPVVKLLLATEKVDVNFKDSWGRTPLSWAAENGHEAVVKLLLATEKVDVNFKDERGRTPLSWAAENGHEAVVKLLLATEKVDVDFKDERGRTPLSWAAEKGHEAVVKLLLATEKVDVDSKDGTWGRTPLSWAVENGHEAVVKLLLATEKVDVDSQDWLARTPLSWAAEKGHEAVVKLLQSHYLTTSPPTTC